MSVTRSTAERLLPYAKGPALEILFREAQDIRLNPGQTPSTELIIKRWERLSADSAVNVASVLTDTMAFDKICLREKRKTVRRAIAGNAHVHPVTRLFLLQEGLRTDDWDLISASLNSMAPTELLSTISGDRSLLRRVGTRVVCAAMLSCDDDNVVREVLDSLGERESLIGMLFDNDLEAAVTLLDRLGLPIVISRIRSIAIRPNVSVGVIRRILDAAGDNHDFRALVANQIGSVAKVAEVDPTLLTLLDLRWGIDDETTKVFVANGAGSHLIRSLADARRLSPSSVELLASAVTNESDRAIVAFYSPDPVKSAAMVTDPVHFEPMARRNQNRGYVQWLLNVAPHLSQDKLLGLVAHLRFDSVSGNLLGRVAEAAGTTVKELLQNLPNAVLLKHDSLPDGITRADIVALASSLDPAVVTHFFTLMLGIHSDVAVEDEEAYVAAAKHLLATEKRDVVALWASAAPRSVVVKLAGEHQALLAQIYDGLPNNKRYRVDWVDLVVDTLAPSNGWGSVSQDKLTSAAMGLLHERIGDDATLWETTLTLYERWTGTLDSLVEAARKL